MYYTKRLVTMAVGLWVILAGIVSAANYYVDPQTGAIGNSGSSTSPWNTLAAVASSKTFTGGDTIFLRSGYHGTVTLSGSPASPVTIIAEEGHNPLIKSIRFNTSKNWIVDGLTITPEATTPYGAVTLVYLTGGATFITVQNCSLYSVKNVSGWTMQDWNDLTCDAFRVDGPNNTVRNNYIMNIDFGISAGYDAESTLVEYNTVANFAGDGLRGLGNYGVFQYNVVKNCYAVNANHDDAFQSWSYANGSVGQGTVYGVVLRGNYFLNWEDFNQPFRGTLQCVGLFDGFFEDWLIENNLIISDHYHGITLLGATNCKVINNTVFSIANATVGPLWIQIDAHKDGRPSTGNIIRNNLGEQLKPLPAGNTADHNILGTYSRLYVMDYVGGTNYHLKPGMPPMYGLAAIDSGSADGAPSVDFEGNPRPWGGGYDIGAYEYSGASGIPNVGYRPLVRTMGNVRVAVNNDIRFNLELGRAGAVAIGTYALDGKVKAWIDAGRLPKGNHCLTMPKQGVVSGIYIYIVTLDGRRCAQGQFILW